MALSAEYAGIAAGVVSFVIGYSWYLVTIIRGETKPHPLSWFILTLVSVIMMVTYDGAGAENTIWVPASNLCFATLIFFLAVKGYLKNRAATEAFEFPIREKIAVVLAVVSLILYLVFHEAEEAFYLVLTAEVLALSMTLEKTIKDPAGENWVAWLGTVSANALNWFAISQQVEYVYVIVTSIIDFAIFAVAFTGYLRRR